MSIGKSIHVDKASGKVKFLESSRKVIATCGFPQRIMLTFSEIHEAGFSCGYTYEDDCDTPPWVNPNRRFILNKTADAGGVIAYECNDTIFRVRFIMQYITYDGNGFRRYIWVYLYRKTAIANCICPLFMSGWEHIWQDEFSDEFQSITDSASSIVGNTGLSLNTGEQYLCIKHRRAWSDYKVWSGYTPSNWQDNKQYNVGELVWATNGDIVICNTQHTSTFATKPITGESWTSKWQWATYSYRHGVDVVTGTDGKKYYSRRIHTSDPSNKPVTGGSWGLYWGACPAEWSSNTTYTSGQVAMYGDNVVRSRYNYVNNKGHTPDVDNDSCLYDYWWEVIFDHNFTTWSSGRLYSGGGGNSRVRGTDNKGYKCIKAHQPHADNKPITGSNWQDYWEFEYKKNTPEIDPDWKEYWAKIKCDTLFQEGRFLVNEQMDEFVTGRWGKVEFSAEIPEFLAWQNDYEYKVGDMVVGDDNQVYACEIDHTSSFENKPVSGTNWNDYWILAECVD
ncbi:MAG: hypothetical protein A2Y10_08530 [Planctomycetes bacterium GWF2_41_51]|nr:MAG: hypothetical protein A2Y10_08530 [Planctomycetes bacterium GWF2_41_51]HBG28579.1 hypothetical protein [Phycisphaerales bacterium]